MIIINITATIVFFVLLDSAQHWERPPWSPLSFCRPHTAGCPQRGFPPGGNHNHDDDDDGDDGDDDDEDDDENGDDDGDDDDDDVDDDDLYMSQK